MLDLVQVYYPHHPRLGHLFHKCPGPCKPEAVTHLCLVIGISPCPCLVQTLTGTQTGMGTELVPTWTRPSACSSSASGAPQPEAFQQNSARLAD